MFHNKDEFQRLVKSEVKRLNDQIRFNPSLDECSEAACDANNRIITDTTLTAKLQTWYMKHRPSLRCTNDLLQILNDEGLDVPSNVDELMRGLESARNNATDHQVDINIDVDPFSHSASGPWGTKVDENADAVKRESCRDSNTLVKELQEQQSQMNVKLNHMMREIAKVNVRLNENAGFENAMHKTSNIFPIENVTALAEFESSLDDTNTGEYIRVVRRIMNSDHLSKSLVRILSKDILLEHNLEGRQKKLALSAYPKLLNILYHAYETYESFSEFTWDLKHAMKRIKNRFHKANCISRKTVLNTSDPLLVDKYSKKLKPDQDDSFF